LLVFVFAFAVLGVEPRALYFTRLGLYHLNHSTSPFLLVIFEIASLFMPEPTWTLTLLFMLPFVTGMLGAFYHSLPLVEMGVSLTFFFFFGFELQAS
jgi:hypothetical protein